MDRAQLRMIASVLFAVSMACLIGMRHLDKVADQRHTALAGEFDTLNESYRALKEHHERARQTHLPEYLKTISFDQIDLQKQSAGQLLTDSNKGNPNRRQVIYQKLGDTITATSHEIARINTYLTTLDDAKRLMATAPEETERAIAEGQAHINAYISKGYFTRIFSNSQQQLAEATRVQQTAAKTQAHYLEAYRLCQKANDLVATAEAKADAVVDQRVQNERLLQEITGRLSQLRQVTLPRAQHAARYLESYPPYHRTVEVETVLSTAGNVTSTHLEPARRHNSMDSQNFYTARNLLIESDRRVRQAEETANHTINWEAEVKQAVANLASARQKANSEIGSAQSRITMYMRNSQSEAERLLRQAEDYRSEGDRLRATDPPRAVRCYLQSASEAQSAYNAVDTSDDDDDDTSWSSSGGGSSFDSGGGSSSYGGGGGGSSSGGGGGSYGGSSGGSYGGSSGGSHGGGF